MSLTEFTGLTSFGTGLNVALTGTTTFGNSSSNVTINSTSFAISNSALSGSYKLPRGWLVNFGSVVTNSAGSNTVTFTTSFTVSPYTVIVTPVATVFSAVCSVNAISNTGFSLFSANASGLTNTGISSVNYFAIGY